MPNSRGDSEDENPFLEPPAKKGLGTAGRKIELFTNWFPIEKEEKDPKIYPFDVEILEIRNDKVERYVEDEVSVKPLLKNTIVGMPANSQPSVKPKKGRPSRKERERLKKQHAEASAASSSKENAEENSKKESEGLKQYEKEVRDKSLRMSIFLQFDKENRERRETSTKYEKERIEIASNYVKKIKAEEEKRKIALKDEEGRRETASKDEEERKVIASNDEEERKVIAAKIEKRRMKRENRKEKKLFTFKEHPVAFDGNKIAYITCDYELPSEMKKEISSDIVLEENNRKYKVIMKRTEGKGKIYRLSDFLKVDENVEDIHIRSDIAQVTQAVDVIFNYGRTEKFYNSGLNTFFSKENAIKLFTLDGGMERREGFFGSIRRVKTWKEVPKLMLNTDIATAVFYKDHQPVIEFLKECFGLQIIKSLEGGGEEMVEELKRVKTKFIDNKIKVEDTHLKAYNKTHNLIDIGPETARSTFLVDGTQKSVMDFFKEKHKVTLKYPDLPCFKSGLNGKNLIPMEVCRIKAGQRVPKNTISISQVTNFFKKTAQERLDDIKEMVRENRFSQDKGLRDLGLKVSPNPTKLTGRVLPSPSVKMDKLVKIDNGKWNVTSHKFQEPMALANWAVINFDSNLKEYQIKKFVGEMKRVAESNGMVFKHPNLGFLKGTRESSQVEDLFKKVLKSVNGLKWILCFTAEKSDLYSVIKVASDRHLKIETACVTGKIASSCKQDAVSKILMKINSKLGGINFSSQLAPEENEKFGVDLEGKNVMFVGVDVNHPNTFNAPSFVAVVATYNKKATDYATEVRHQTRRKEFITDMREIMLNLLLKYKRSTGEEPDRIFVYRDGVSNSQFTAVLRSELGAIRAACADFKLGYTPSITFLCAQKRHHTRLFPANRMDAMGKSGNVPAGTIVDDVITQPEYSDFYLTSHQGLLGTSRPTHYTTLWDDADTSPDLIQLLTYTLCYGYARTPSAVSIPTPVYYAHLAAKRGKVHLEGVKDQVEAIEAKLSKGEKLLENDEYIALLTRTCNVTSAEGDTGCWHYFM